MKALKIHATVCVAALLFVLNACSTRKTPSIKYDVFVDARDGQAYKTIKFGKSEWMAENLNYAMAGSSCYGNDPENGKLYGRLYNFDALLKGAAPKGWHVPSETEWKAMESTLSDPVRMLNVKFAGAFGLGKFSELGQKASFYTSTQDGYPIDTHYLTKGADYFKDNKNGIGWQLSVRCVKDTVM